MDGLSRDVCAICGDERSSGEIWFLVAENRWEDRIRLLRWNDGLAGREGVHRACGARHVEELVVHWMTTGSLEYPFARTALGARTHRRRSERWPAGEELDDRATEQIGELAVHRESIERVLSESPDSLRPILDALAGVLHQEVAPGVAVAPNQEAGISRAV